MFTLFIISLSLLTALFALKLIELRVGRRIFLASLRRRGDQFALRMYRKLEDGFYTLLDKSQLYSESWTHRTRRHLSRFLEHLARQLRK